MANPPEKTRPRKTVKKPAIARWENEGGAPAETPQAPAQGEQKAAHEPGKGNGSSAKRSSNPQ